MLEKNHKPIHIVVFFSRILVGVMLVFIFVLFLVKSPLQPSSSTLKLSMGKINYSPWFIYMLGSENHALFTDEKMKDISFSKVLFTFITNVNPSKSMTLLGREIPGLEMYNTEIAMAGKGSDYTNLPVDHVPNSLDDVTKERSPANNQIKDNSDPNKQNSNTNDKNLKKVVYIYHTHSWESFLPLINGAKVPDDATSTNNSINVVAVGDRLSKDLTNKGIGTIHDTSIMGQELRAKNWTTNDAYRLSREHVVEAMAQDKDMKFLIDIHRDSARKNITTATISGKKYARIEFIIGKENKNYKENLNLAKDLFTKLEKEYPGICRGVYPKDKSEGNGIYNQDLSNRSILLEFGGVDNNLAELNNSVDAFAKIFSEYYLQAEEVNG